MDGDMIGEATQNAISQNDTIREYSADQSIGTGCFKVSGHSCRQQQEGRNAQ
jgi:hypothetical protein